MNRYTVQTNPLTATDRHVVSPNGNFVADFSVFDAKRAQLLCASLNRGLDAERNLQEALRQLAQAQAALAAIERATADTPLV